MAGAVDFEDERDVRGDPAAVAEGDGALTQLKAYLAQHELAPNTRLPPERELCEILGVSRGELRKALAVLEEHGDIWRHVGKGTFTGARPAEERISIAEISSQTNPAEVMRARLLIEPELAREAALNANADDVAALSACLAGSRTSETWRQYENWDNRFHRAIASATHNALLIALFDTLNGVRRAVVWGRLRYDIQKPPPDHHSFADHEAIIAAIAERDMNAAATRMRAHLQIVQARLLDRPREAAE
ncbi:FadR/GntR family transcriptional regulator [Propylenella binzhouense]|uniref:FadR family transcriptional regulator n=1 Tax=Propylenella binzhouense TaxID=2555902 RepID=A0A964T7N4_9HYPH|nr:FCD domain-containing protein [Propylenella binzhouense]MYZ50048.1 FadR family transcriptional regulator [Propylenella binzhouense]